MTGLELESALLHALEKVYAATDIDYPDALDRYVKFIPTRCLKTHKMVVEEVTQNFRIADVKRD